MRPKSAGLALAATALAALVALSFAEVAVTPGLVGRAWDWGVPPLAEQFRLTAQNHLSTWDAYFETGRYHYFKLELLYWLLLTPLATVGGEIVSRFLPPLFVFCAGAAMLVLARRLGLRPFYAWLSAVLYALSPYSFSRVIAGHLPMLAGYALLPLVVAAALGLIDRVLARRPGGAYFTVLTGALLGLTSLHPGAGMSAAALATILFAHRLAGGRRKAALAGHFLAAGLLAVLLNIHFMAPFLGDYLGRGAISHGWGLSVSAEGEVTVDSELPRREAYHESTSQPPEATALLDLRPGMDTEYVFPPPAPLALPWRLAALAVALSAFGYAFSRQRTPGLDGLFWAALAGLVLVAGSRTLPGAVLYQLVLKKTLPILFAAFSNTTRWLPVLILPYALLAPRLAQALEDGQPGGPARPAGRTGRVRFLAALAVLVFVSPYLTGQLVRDHDPKTDIQPLSLTFSPVHPEDARVYAFLRDHRASFRVAYLPPVGLTWPGPTPHGFEWASAYSPKPFFLAFQTHPLGREIIEGLYAPYPSAGLARLMGLASVRYLVYPRYDAAYTYVDFQPDYPAERVVDGYKDYKPIFDANLARLSELRPVPLFEGIDVYENTAFLPPVRAGDRLAAVERTAGRAGGNIVARAVAELAALPDFDPATVYVRAGREARFLRFLDTAMGRGQRLTRILFERETGRTLLLTAPASAPPAPTIEFRRVSPTRCRVRAHNVRGAFPLIFQETFHAGWRAYLAPMSASAWPMSETLIRQRLGDAAPRPSLDDQPAADELARLAASGAVSTLGDGRTRDRVARDHGAGGRLVATRTETFRVDFVSRPSHGALQNDNLPDLGLLEVLSAGRLVPDAPLADPLDPAAWRAEGADGREPVAWPELFHLEAYGFANAWWLDPALVSRLPEAAGTSPGYFRRHADGGLDMEIILDFAPQGFYALGLAVSGATLACCLIYLAAAPLAARLRRRAQRTPDHA